MTWLIYDNCDDKTHVFIGVLLIGAIVFIAGASFYFWVSEKFKKE